MNTPWILDEAEAKLVAQILLEQLLKVEDWPEVESLLAQYTRPRHMSIDRERGKFVRHV